MGAEWGEYLPTELPKSSTGWHLIWLNNQAMAFEILNSGDKFALINLNNGGRFELDNNTHYWCALNAAPPESVSMGSHRGSAFGKPTATNEPCKPQVGLLPPRKRKAPSTAEMDAAIFDENGKVDMFAGQDLSDPKDMTRNGINNQIGRNK